ncbi:MAG: hypothetical protein HC905_14120 [Bacteroidales bacterium]|nr:hypothetical protein [Bacteroidales bacterium]
MSNLITDTSRKEQKSTVITEKTYLVKTLNIAEDDFKFIKKYVRYRRMGGDTEFTQKEALEEAISMLKDKYPEVAQNL